MKRTIFTMSAAFCIAFSSVLLSCDGIAQKIDGGGQADSEKEFVISGTLSLDGAVPSEIASVFRNESGNERTAANGNTNFSENSSSRTAVPTIPVPIDYKISATKSGSSDSVEGVVDKTNKTFTIKLSSGTWTLTGEGFSDSDKKILILKGTSSSVTLNNENPVKNDISITLSPVNSETGTVNLAVGWERASNINSAKMTFTELSNKSQILADSTSSGDFTGTFNFQSIQSGSHKVKIEFFSSSSETGTVLYSTHEVINVFQNLTTGTWQGTAPYFTETDGKTEFKVTKTLVDAFSNRKVFYVQGTGGTYTPQTAASDSNTGTYFDPFATLQKAIDTVKNDGTSAYKIYVDGTLEGKAADFKSGNQNALAYINEQSKDLNLTIEGLKGSGNTSGAKIDAKRTEQENGRVFYINAKSGSSITIKNITITGGNSGTSENGAGIHLRQGNLTLSSCTVTGNHSGTNSNGGGIYVESNSGCILTLNENTTVSSNTTKGSGGGIYAGINAVLNIENATITENSADSHGAGIHLNSAEATLTNATITKNKGATASNGGGIYMSSSGKTVQITDGTISGNNNVQKGGGIYLNEGTLTLTNTTISDNSLSNGNNDGKSIYAGNLGTINFAGSTVTTSESTEEDVYLLVHEPDGAKEFAKIYVTEKLSRNSYPKSSDDKDVACYLKFASTDLQKLSGQTIIQKTPSKDEDSIKKFSLLDADEYRISPSSLSGGSFGVGSNGYKGVLLKNYN